MTRLLSAGANVSHRNKRGETPLSLAYDPLTIRSLLVSVPPLLRKVCVQSSWRQRAACSELPRTRCTSDLQPRASSPFRLFPRGERRDFHFLPSVETPRRITLRRHSARGAGPNQLIDRLPAARSLCRTRRFSPSRTRPPPKARPRRRRRSCRRPARRPPSRSRRRPRRCSPRPWPSRTRPLRRLRPPRLPPAARPPSPPGASTQPPLRPPVPAATAHRFTFSPRAPAPPPSPAQGPPR